MLSSRELVDWSQSAWWLWKVHTVTVWRWYWLDQMLHNNWGRNS